MRLETNFVEIVDVQEVSAAVATEKQIACLEEAVWAERLPPPFRLQSVTWDISI